MQYVSQALRTFSRRVAKEMIIQGYWYVTSQVGSHQITGPQSQQGAHESTYRFKPLYPGINHIQSLPRQTLQTGGECKCCQRLELDRCRHSLHMRRLLVLLVIPAVGQDRRPHDSCNKHRLSEQLCIVVRFYRRRARTAAGH